MRVHAIYLVGELVDRLSARETPSDIDGNMPPVMAWKRGYMAALGELVDGLKEQGKEEKVG